MLLSLLKAPDRLGDRHIRLISLGVLIAAIVILGSIAVRLGADGNGDLRNYHYYGGWALLKKAAGYDIAPAGLQTYHYPLLDSAYYLLSRWLNYHPLIFTFLWSVPQAVAVWLTFHIARLALAGLPSGRNALSALACAIGAGGATSIGTVGTSMSEGIVNTVICGAILLILQADRDWPDRSMLARYAAAGALAGSAAMLKLVNAPYLLAFGVAILVAKLMEPAVPRLRALLVFGLCAGVAAVLLGAPWWWTVYRVTGNPLFPYFNTVFHSPYFPDIAFTDRRFLPRSTLEWLTYPLEWALRKSNRVSESPARDLRILVEVLAALGLLLAAGVHRLRGAVPSDPARLWLAAFVLAAYLIWLKVFSILRYASGLETLSGVMIICALAAVVPARRPGLRLTAGLCAAAVLFATTVVPTWERRRHPGRVLVGVEMPTLPADSTVLLIGPYETAFIAAFQPRSVRFIGAFTNLMHDFRTPALDRLIGQTVAAAPGPLWTIAAPGPLEDQVVRLLAGWGVRRTEDCRPVTATIVPPMALCRVERLASG